MYPVSRFSILFLQGTFLCFILTSCIVGCSSGGSTPLTPSQPDRLSDDYDNSRTHDTPSAISNSDASVSRGIIFSQPVTYIVLLDQSDDVYTMARETVDAQYPQIDTLNDRIGDIYRNNRGMETSSAVQSQVRPLTEQIMALRRQKASDINFMLHSALDGIHDDIASRIELIPDTVVIGRDVILNALVVETYSSHFDEIISLPGIIAVEEGVIPEPLMDTTAQALKLRPGAYPDVVWDQDIHGEGVSVMALDTGVNTSHSAFVGLDLQSQYFPTNATGCNFQDSSNHGTHTAGVVGSQDATYTGMSYGIDTFYNAKMCSGYDGYASLQEAFEWAGQGGTGGNDAAVINFSMVFGASCTQANGLHFVSAYVDNTIDMYDVVWSLGAGNKNVGCPGNFIRDKPQTSYNGVSVVGVLDGGTGLRDNDSYLSASKYGPCYGPYSSEERLKPDIMGYSGAYSPASNGDWGNFGGTSCAAPHFAGFAAILMSAGVTGSMEVRALAFATAEDFTKSPGSAGVDYYSGFGIPDGWAAYSHIADTYSDTLYATGEANFYRIDNVQDGDRLVLVYNKHGLTANWKISNFDILAYDASDGTLLHETTAIYENKEYIEFGPSDAGKDFIISAKVTTLADGLGYDDYAISATNTMVELEEPTVETIVTADSPVDYGQVFTVQAQVTNTGIHTIDNCLATISLDSGMELDTSENATKQLGDGIMDPSDVETVSWNVVITEYEPNKTVFVNGGGDFFGATFTDDGNDVITVNLITADIDPVLVVPTEPVDVDELFEISATITNNEIFTLTDVSASLGIDTGMEFAPGEEPQKTCGDGTLDPDEFCEVSWEVKVVDYTPTKEIAVHSDASAFGVDFTGNAYAQIEVIEPYMPDPLAPILITPFPGFDYNLGDELPFTWEPASGTNPDSYWFDAWIDGQHFDVIPAGGLDLGDKQALLLPAIFVELNARDGVWEWAAGSMISGVKHWSDPWVVVKSVAPVLVEPVNWAEVDVNQLFNWDNVYGAENYVAQVTGLLPAGQPFYLPLNAFISQFILSQPYYDALKTGVTYTWAIAGTTMAPPLDASDQQMLSQLSYSEIRSFTKID